MATAIRPETSKRNRYWISKHRYYELKHRCLQYPEWKRQLAEIEYAPQSVIFSDTPRGTDVADKTGNTAVEVVRLKLLINSVEKAARGADLSIAGYILEAVTKGRSYTYLHEKLGMPCGRDYFYTRYRKFFWLLDKL